MTRALVPLSMSTVADLPGPALCCVSWQVPDGGRAEFDEASRRFEKEVWLSGVMLTWGSAGLLATVDDRPAGYALFAPPTAVPGAARFAAGPVSPDAVLLTCVGVLPEFRGRQLAAFLLTGVLGALARRGVRAVEAFGAESPEPAATGAGDGGDTVGRDSVGRDPVGLDSVGCDTAGPCVLPADVLRAAGFTDIRPHPEYPRLRFELASGLDWKAEVEAALDKLTTEVFVPTHRDRTLVGVG